MEISSSILAIAAVFVALGAGLVGLTLGRYVWPATRATDAAALATSQIEAAQLSERLQVLTQQVQEASERMASLEAQKTAAGEEVKTASAEVARLREREAGLNTRIGEQAQQLADVQKQLTTKFENIANRILKVNREKNGLTQAQAAERLGLTLRGYVKLEQGDRQPNEPILAMAAELFRAAHRPKSLASG